MPIKYDGSILNSILLWHGTLKDAFHISSCLVTKMNFPITQFIMTLHFYATNCEIIFDFKIYFL